MPHKFNAKRRHKFAKARYRVRNWPDYDRALCRRGDLRLWISEAAIEKWRVRSGRGIYSDLAIEMALTVRLVFGLGLRQTEGFLGSVMGLLDLALPVPDHTTLSRRGRRLELSRPTRIGRGSLDIVVDSTGLGIYGPGEWRSEIHGNSARRQWRKLHIAIDPDGGEIVASVLTPSDVGDVTVLPDLLEQVDGRIETYLADGAYDGEPTYQRLIQRRQGHPLPRVVTPPRGARDERARELDLLRTRDRHIHAIQSHGRMAWQKSSGYNRRALVETSISRYKRIIGERLRTRSLPAQRVEPGIGVSILNKMARLGMPVTERVA